MFVHASCSRALLPSSKYSLLPKLISTRLLATTTNLSPSPPVSRQGLPRGEPPAPPRRVAVILAGCGPLDGTEPLEAHAILDHLSRHPSIGGLRECESIISRRGVVCFSPTVHKYHIIDHMNGSVTPQVFSRQMLDESSRITRGHAGIELLPLRNLVGSVQEFDALFVPGGIGTCKNLCDFAFEGPNCDINDDFRDVMLSFSEASKPIGMSSLIGGVAPVIFKGCEVTLGSAEPEGGRWPHHGAASAVTMSGGKHVRKDVNEVH
eukprot:UC4_evm1s1230